MVVALLLTACALGPRPAPAPPAPAVARLAWPDALDLPGRLTWQETVHAGPTTPPRPACASARVVLRARRDGDGWTVAWTAEPEGPTADCPEPRRDAARPPGPFRLDAQGRATAMDPASPGGEEWWNRSVGAWLGRVPAAAAARETRASPVLGLTPVPTDIRDDAEPPRPCAAGGTCVVLVRSLLPDPVAVADWFRTFQAVAERDPTFPRGAEVQASVTEWVTLDLRLDDGLPAGVTDGFQLVVRAGGPPARREVNRRLAFELPPPPAR